MTELSNLCGLAQVRAVKKSCHAALVFSHGSGAPRMVSGNDGAVNAGTTPYHMGDPLQGSGDP